MNAPGLRVLSRKSYEAQRVSIYDNPLSSRFDENDALLYFDDVKVPWDRVFVHRDTDMCRAQFHDTPGHIFQNYQAQVRLSVKLKFLVGLAHKITEAIGTTNMPQVREQLGALAAHATVVESMVHGMEAQRAACAANSTCPTGTWSTPPTCMTPGALPAPGQLDPRPRRRRADHAAIVVRGLDQSGARRRSSANPNARQISVPDQKVKLLKAPGTPSARNSHRGTSQYEMFYAGARFVTTGHSYRTYDWERAGALVDGLLASYDLKGSLPRD